MIAYARTAALLAALWGLALLLDESVVIAAAISLALVATHAAIVLTRRRRERRNAAALIRGLRAQAESQLSFTRPDLIDEIGAMAEQFMGAVETLRSSHLGKQGSEALYAIPWYMIIGPPGSGKTTALRNSGLNFPLQAPQAGIRGFAGTRNCEWWLTNDGVLIDTAGRYTADDDHDEWLAFLDLLRSYRPRRPIEGVLVGVAVDDLGGIGEEQIVDRARQIRARINEVMKRLQVVTPVYVLFTKCDLIPGFVELFGPMTRSQRAEIWGFTFPVEQRGALGARFVECFARLTDAVEAHALRKLIDQRSVTGRARVACFGEQLRALGPNLGLFVNTLFTDNVYQETPILRGVYFTSGTQEGRPIDRLLGAMAEAFGLDHRAPAEPPTDAKSYFLERVFTDVIFPDRALAMPTARAARRARIVELSAALGLGALGAGLIACAAVAFAAADARAKEIIEEVEQARTEADLAAAAERYRASAPLERALHMECRAQLPRRVASGAIGGAP